MKRLVFGIFAHPDDEAFGPAGTLLHMVDNGHDLHLICATDGAAGINCDKVADLGSLRCHEWQAAGKAFGASSLQQLGFTDGSLSNCQFHDIAKQVRKQVLSICQNYDQPVSLKFMTFENGGLTGHIDHIVMSMVASYVYYQLQSEKPTNITFDGLWYFCLPRSVAPKPDTSFVFMPAGRSPAEISHREDISDVLGQKLAIMRLHRSQRKDAQAIIAKLKNELAFEHFITAK